jgi:hypothetical protein
LSDNDGNIVSAACYGYCELLKKSHKLSNTAILRLQKALLNSDARWNASTALNEAIKTQKQELPNSSLEKLSLLLNDSSAPLQARRNCCWALSYAAENGQILHNDIISSLENALSDNDGDIVKAACYGCFVLLKKSHKLSNTAILGLEKALLNSDARWNASVALLQATKTHKQVLPVTTLEKLARLLIDTGSKPEERNNSCRTLAYAAENGQKLDLSIINYLL